MCECLIQMESGEEEDAPKNKMGKNLTLKHSSVCLGVFIQLNPHAVMMGNEDTCCWMHFILSLYLEQEAVINFSLLLRLLSATALCSFSL